MKHAVSAILVMICALASLPAHAQFNLPSAIGNALGGGGGNVPVSPPPVPGVPTVPGVPDANGMQNIIEGMDSSNQAGPRFEYMLGYAIAAMVLGGHKPLPLDSPVSRYVDQVGQAVALASNNPFPYKGYLFVVLDTPEINAFAAPAGFVFITTGMLKFLRNEDELAGVLGHEVAHVELNHGLRTLKEGRGWQSAGELFKLDQGMLGPVYDEMNKSMRDGYSADLEAEADTRSAEMCAKLGYNAVAFRDVLERFRQKTGTYGGAKYPDERGKLYADKLAAMRFAQPAPVPGRTDRFASMLGLLP